MPIRVFLVEPCRFVADALALTLTRRDDLVLVGAAGRLEEALSWLEAGDVDVLLLGAADDLALAVREIVRRYARVKVVALGVGDCPDGIVRLIEAGAGGYVVKEALLDDMLEVVAAVHAGETRCSPRVAAQLFRRLAELAQALGHSPGGPRESLSAREEEILEMIAAGLANKQIARRLNLALCTVKNHVHSILEKLRVSHRHEAGRLARAHRLLEREDAAHPFHEPTPLPMGGSARIPAS
jgi:two-component system, NarL family, nitrate/nitrite response regulator NarL